MPEPQWETDEEFDEGGTPTWRARHAYARTVMRRPVTIDAPPRTFREAWGRLTVQQTFLICLFVPWFLMAAIVIGGFGYLILSDWIMGHLPS